MLPLPNLNLKNQDVELEANILDVGIGYPETMDLQIIQGRSFTKEFEERISKFLKRRSMKRSLLRLMIIIQSSKNLSFPRINLEEWKI